MKIAFYGSSLLSSYWNGAATYYRGILRALAAHGHRITFYEPDAYERQQHRDIEPPDWVRVVVYPATVEGARQVIAVAGEADIVIKASGVGVFDELLLEELAGAARPDALYGFWDVDAPATLAEIGGDPDHPLRRLLPRLDFVLTYGGGPPVVAAYEGFGARLVRTVYNALDPETHRPAAGDPRFDADLAFLGNRLPDREARVDTFFVDTARRLPQRRFLLGGAGWQTKTLPSNVKTLGHVYTDQHNAFNTTPLAVLNIARDSMARTGYSPATRVFEAAGAGACIITDAWTGIELFLEPESEILVARDGEDVAALLQDLSRDRARSIGAHAYARVVAQHTYKQRAAAVNDLFVSGLAAKRARAAA
jgi:spore maturation protein CgeB